jgi:hypothetical protein
MKKSSKGHGSGCATGTSTSTPHQQTGALQTNQFQNATNKAGWDSQKPKEVCFKSHGQTPVQGVFKPMNLTHVNDTSVSVLRLILRLPVTVLSPNHFMLRNHVDLTLCWFARPL